MKAICNTCHKAKDIEDFFLAPTDSPLELQQFWAESDRIKKTCFDCRSEARRKKEDREQKKLKLLLDEYDKAYRKQREFFDQYYETLYYLSAKMKIGTYTLYKEKPELVIAFDNYRKLKKLLKQKENEKCQ